jgi:hypothetical protein
MAFSHTRLLPGMETGNAQRRKLLVNSTQVVFKRRAWGRRANAKMAQQIVGDRVGVMTPAALTGKKPGEYQHDRCPVANGNLIRAGDRDLKVVMRFDRPQMMAGSTGRCNTLLWGVGSQALGLVCVPWVKPLSC